MMEEMHRVSLEQKSADWWRGYGFEGRMSETDYGHWTMNASSSGVKEELWSLPNFDLYLKDRAERQFEILRHSEFILDNFFKLPNKLRQCIDVFANSPSSLSHIEAFARLAFLLLPLDLNRSHENTPAFEFSNYLKNRVHLSLDTKSSADFDSALYAYVMFYNRDENLELINSVVYMLCLLHGASLVLDVLQGWTSGSCPGTPADFVTVVENWNSSFTGYPLEWIVNVVSRKNFE